jgi:hypothetical protein
MSTFSGAGRGPRHKGCDTDQKQNTKKRDGSRKPVHKHKSFLFCIKLRSAPVGVQVER